MKSNTFFFYRRHLFFLIFLFAFIYLLKAQSNLPPEINFLFFQASEFARPVWLELPEESSFENFNRISQTPDIYERGLPSAVVLVGEGLEDYDRHILSFLVENGFANIQTRKQTRHSSYGSQSTTFHFIFYSEDLKKKIQNFKVKDFWGEYKIKPFVALANRQLLSVDYKNEYEDAPFGMRRTFYSITFKYKLVNNLHQLPAINAIFQGKGKAFKDPDDGKWKMKGPFENLGLVLGDGDKQEFLSHIKRSYKPFDFEVNYNNSIGESSVSMKSSNTASNIQHQSSNRDTTTRTPLLKPGYVGDLVVASNDKPNIDSLSGDYSGSLYEGKKHGIGKMIYQNGNIYEGEWANDRRNGKGKQIYINGFSYEGEWSNDSIEGKGTWIENDGKKYVGDFANGIRNGIGILFDQEGERRYEGGFKNGLFHGYGVLIYNKRYNSLYEGNFRNGKFDGQGDYFFENDNQTTNSNGEFKEGKLLNGRTIVFFKKDRMKMISEGEFRNDDLFNGTRTTIYSTGSKIVTKFVNGIMKN